MEDLSNFDVGWVRKKYGDIIEKVATIKFSNCNDSGITEIHRNKITSRLYEYTIDKLPNMIFLPVDTKIDVRLYEDKQWHNHGSVITFALIKPGGVHMITSVLLMGGGYAIMDRYMVDEGDEIKFVTMKEMDKFTVMFKNVLMIKR
jgi:hypothetical protein